MHTTGWRTQVVDTVIITYAQPDHVGGALDDSGNLIFANADYYIGRTEWNYWMSEAAADSALPNLGHVIKRTLGWQWQPIKSERGWTS